ncbi:hypothetical protein GCM10018793_06640 [Streptomyces sulfonofaciens]|uniref:Uncharacterized protein n=1 Tax=Streptomyces sulfonofaciens TaxID=68272 RepID=A0A919KSH8_9ACTN|nr:hypothetical protein GCM10018793_06640 [Streptomyces sulfonofaciens]
MVTSPVRVFPASLRASPLPTLHAVSASAEPAPRRERVTGEPRTVHRLPGHRTQWEIDEQTTLGAAYVRSLMRSQLRAGLAAFALLALPVVTLPLFFAALRNATVVWAVLGFCCYPLLVLLARWYIRRAERNERDFARLVRGADHDGPP